MIMEGTFQKRIEELLSCSVCLECFKSPKTLSCDHTFCQQCLELIGKRMDWIINCPTCRKKQWYITKKEDIEALDANLYIKQAVDIIGAMDTEENLSDQDFANDNLQETSNDIAQVESLLEDCFICADDGQWQRQCDENYNDNYVTNNDETQCQVINETGDISSTEVANRDVYELYFTQRYTFENLRKTLFSCTSKSNLCKKDTEFVNACIKKRKISQEGLLNTQCTSASSKSNNIIHTKSNKDIPSYISAYSRAQYLEATALTGLCYRPKFKSGTLLKHKPYIGMLGYGCKLSHRTTTSWNKNTKFRPKPSGSNSQNYHKKPAFRHACGPLRRVVFLL